MVQNDSDFGVFDLRIRYVWDGRLYELRMTVGGEGPTSVFFDREEMEKAREGIDVNEHVLLSPDGEWDVEVPGVRVSEVREPWSTSREALSQSTPLCWHHRSTCYWFCMS